MKAESFSNGMIAGIFIMAVISILIIIFVTDVNDYNKGYNQGINDTLNNYTCTERLTGEINRTGKINFTLGSMFIANPNLLGDLNIDTFRFSGTPDWIATFSPDYSKIKINGEVCHEVPCDCYKWGCMAYCMECEQ